MQTDATSHKHLLRVIVGRVWPTMLRLFAWAQKFDRFQTIRNKSEQVPTLLWFHANGRNMLIGPTCSVACCWPTMLRPFEPWALIVDKLGLGTWPSIIYLLASPKLFS